MVCPAVSRPPNISTRASPPPPLRPGLPLSYLLT